MPVKVAYTVIKAPRNKSFAEFLEENELNLVVTEKPNGFIAEFRTFVEKRIGSACLGSVWEWGTTADAAIRKLADNLRGKKLKIGGREVTCPEHWREV